MTVPAGHQPFSDQCHHIANQYLFWLAKLTVHFQCEGNKLPTKKFYFEKQLTNC